MDLPKVFSNEGGVLNGIKSRLGFSDDKQDPYDDDYYYDDDDYEDGYDDDLDDEYEDDYDDEYEDEPRSPRGAFQRLRSRAGFDGGRTESADRSASGSVRSVSSNLVNIEDVRARRRATEALGRNPLNEPQTRSSYERDDSFRRMTSSDSYDSHAGSVQSDQVQDHEEPRVGFDPYEAYSGEGETLHAPTRSMSVLRPASYSEVEQVARCLRAGDMVVLNLKNTPGDLAKRILDFSFGAASMVDAHVECVGEKVFALSMGVALTDDEKAGLIAQGAM